MKLKIIFLFSIICFINVKAQTNIAAKIYVNKLLNKGLEGSIEIANAKAAMGHEFVVGFSQPYDIDKLGRYKNINFEYRMNNYLFGSKPLEGFIITAPIANFQLQNRTTKDFTENLKIVGIGGTVGYQVFLTKKDSGNLLLNAGIGTILAIPVDIYKKNNTNNKSYDDFDKAASVANVLIQNLFRLHIGLGYKF